MRVLVVTVSDRCSRGESTDLSGPAVTDVLREYFNEKLLKSATGLEGETNERALFHVASVLVPDETDRIQRVIATATDASSTDPQFPHLIVLTGGTGFSARDVTPEAVRPLLDKEASGLVHLMLHVSLQATPFGWLSRPVAGTRKRTLILTLPGSPKAVREILSPLLRNGLEHAVALASGEQQQQHPTQPQPLQPKVPTEVEESSNVPSFVPLEVPTVVVPRVNISPSRSRSTGPQNHTSPSPAKTGREGSYAASLPQSTTPRRFASDHVDASGTLPSPRSIRYLPVVGTRTSASPNPVLEGSQTLVTKGSAPSVGRREVAVGQSPSVQLPPLSVSGSQHRASPPKEPCDSEHALVPAAHGAAATTAAEGEHATKGGATQGGVAWRNRESQYPMVPMDEAIRTVVDVTVASQIQAIVTVPTLKALGHVVADSVRSSFPHPPFPASVKDGYAVVASDGPGLYPVVGALVAGSSPDAFVLRPGQICRVNTGGPVPQGADAVVQVEDTKVMDVTLEGEEAAVFIQSRVSPGHDIRPVGCDLSEGGVAIAAGMTMHAPEIGLAMSVGASSVRVYRKPRVAILSTGDELQEVSTLSSGDSVRPSFGKIFDSNKGMLMAAVTEAGFDVVDAGVAADNMNATRERLMAAVEASDVIISSGGVSMGEVDCLKQCLLDLGATIHFGRVNMKPGKPTTFASLGPKLFFALPGNPVSAMVCFHLFVMPALLAASGMPTSPFTLRARLEHAVRLDPERPEYHRCVISKQSEVTGGTGCSFTAKSTGIQASHRLLSMSGANGLMVLPRAPSSSAGDRTLPAESEVEVIVIGGI